MNEYFYDKLTPRDTEIAIMVESLVGKPCEIQNGGDCWFMQVDYSEHPDSDYLAAVMAAIEGKAGDRFLEFKDMPDNNSFLVYIAFDKKDLPQQAGYIGMNREARKWLGVFNEKTGLWEIEVDRKRYSEVIAFIGGGEWEIEKCPGGKATFHFVDRVSGVIQHVNEGDVLVRLENGRIIVRRNKKSVLCKQ